VAVVGAGAVGITLGARLAVAGADVRFVVRPERVASFRATGLRLLSFEGDVWLPPQLPRGEGAEGVEVGGGRVLGTRDESGALIGPPVVVTDDPGAIGVVDVVLVCVKAGQVAAVAPTLRPLVGAHTAVVPTQNGVEASALLADALGAGAVLEGLARVIAEPVSPGVVRHTAVTPLLEFGARGGVDAAAYPALGQREALAAWLRAAGLHAVQPPDMAVALWEKFLFIDPIGVVCAASGHPFGVVRGDAALRAQVDACLSEVVAVGGAMGVAWPDDAVARVWRRYEALPADGFTSMARDLLAGRPSELDSQVGAVVRLGRRFGVPTPVHFRFLEHLAG
jgi:2-dehydropantoate 2-reductase